MVTAADTKFTRDEYMQLPEGFRAELLDGMLVKDPAPAGWHQVLVLRLAHGLLDLVGSRRVVVSPVDVFVDRHNVLQPDVLVLAEADRLRPGAREVATPILVIEVLSPSTADRDRHQKTAIYLRAGVEEVWLVDPETETTEIHTPSGVERFSVEDAPRSAVVPGFAVDLRALFGP